MRHELSAVAFAIGMFVLTACSEESEDVGAIGDNAQSTTSGNNERTSAARNYTLADIEGKVYDCGAGFRMIRDGRLWKNIPAAAQYRGMPMVPGPDLVIGHDNNVYERAAWGSILGAMPTRLRVDPKGFWPSFRVLSPEKIEGLAAGDGSHYYVEPRNRRTLQPKIELPGGDGFTRHDARNQSYENPFICEQFTPVLDEAPLFEAFAVSLLANAAANALMPVGPMLPPTMPDCTNGNGTREWDQDKELMVFQQCNFSRRERNYGMGIALTGAFGAKTRLVGELPLKAYAAPWVGKSKTQTGKAANGQPGTPDGFDYTALSETPLFTYVAGRIPVTAYDEEELSLDKLDYLADISKTGQTGPFWFEAIYRDGTKPIRVHYREVAYAPEGWKFARIKVLYAEYDGKKYMTELKGSSRPRFLPYPALGRQVNTIGEIGPGKPKQLIDWRGGGQLVFVRYGTKDNGRRGGAKRLQVFDVREQAIQEAIAAVGH